MAQPVLIGKYLISDLLGSGSFASVYLGYDPEGNLVAIKLLKDKVRPLAFLQEVKIMTTYGGHKNLVTLIERLQSTTLQGLSTSPQLPPSSYGIVMEYIGKDTLLTYVNREGAFSELQARIVFKSIISGIQHLHNCGIVHRDLKAENILFRSDLSPVICDMGFATFWSPTKKLTRSCGSLHYASPEIVNGAPYIGPEIDVWSLGVVLYAIIAGSLPWNGDSQELVEAIEIGDYWRWAWFSPELIELLDFMLHPEAGERWSISQIIHSRWFLDIETSVSQQSQDTSSMSVQGSSQQNLDAEQTKSEITAGPPSVLAPQLVDSASSSISPNAAMPEIKTTRPSDESVSSPTQQPTTTTPSNVLSPKKPLLPPKVDFITLEKFKELQESERGLFVSGRRSGKALLNSRQTLLSPHILKSPRFTKGLDPHDEASERKSPLQHEGTQIGNPQDPSPHLLSPRVKELLTPTDQTLAEMTLSGNRRSLSGLDIHMTQLRFKEEKQQPKQNSEETAEQREAKEREAKERNELDKKKKRWSLGINDLRELEERAGSLFGTKNDPIPAADPSTHPTSPAATHPNPQPTLGHNKNWKTKLSYLKSKLGGTTKPKKDPTH